MVAAGAELVRGWMLTAQGAAKSVEGKGVMMAELNAREGGAWAGRRWQGKQARREGRLGGRASRSGLTWHPQGITSPTLPPAALGLCGPPLWARRAAGRGPRWWPPLQGRWTG